MANAAELIEQNLLQLARRGIELRHGLYERFFAAFPERRSAFLCPEATSIRMTDETLQMLHGIAAGESWVWPLIAELIATHGAVSEPVVRAMAHGAALHAQVPIAVASTGIAGPDGGSPDKPVGTVWLGWWVDGVVRSQCFHFDGPRSSVRAQAVYQALLHLEKIIAAQGAKADPGPRP